MDIPFVYGKIVADSDFTDREEETRKLVDNFRSQTNTAIISPRRWGKSSLVNREEYLEKELTNALPRVQCLELEIEHMTGKLVNES